jgi:hypothetical protein
MGVGETGINREDMGWKNEFLWVLCRGRKLAVGVVYVAVYKGVASREWNEGISGEMEGDIEELRREGR